MLLRALIIEAGGPAPAAAQLAAAIVDWRAAGATGASSVRSYQAAGLPYTPPHAPFRSVAELSDVVGMTSDLFARIAPHLTVMSDDDPAPSTRDPVVAKALADLGDTADANRNAPFDDHVLRMHMTAAGPGGSRLSTIEVVMTDFHAISPCLAVLFRYSN
ncbi:MAG TPA: hypothetical protein VHB27_12195 [Rhodopila sp.]|uniref:hypothetical protein n=1 Tax=Rhodopila sp. TaxID=2480087 RepID=UPI002BC71EE0|nr:hypothetical protein [Rhodopila sp.]HVY15980.1 hypothetical protein [Rhodopila sp.]